MSMLKFVLFESDIPLKCSILFIINIYIKHKLLYLSTLAINDPIDCDQFWRIHLRHGAGSRWVRVESMWKINLRVCVWWGPHVVMTFINAIFITPHKLFLYKLQCAFALIDFDKLSNFCLFYKSVNMLAFVWPDQLWNVHVTQRAVADLAVSWPTHPVRTNPSKIIYRQNLFIGNAFFWHSQKT